MKFIEIARKYNINLKTRKELYRIDFLINNDIWLEVTLNNQEAHKKILKYAHQCKQLGLTYLSAETLGSLSSTGFSARTCMKY